MTNIDEKIIGVGGKLFNDLIEEHDSKFEEAYIIKKCLKKHGIKTFENIDVSALGSNILDTLNILSNLKDYEYLKEKYPEDFV